MHSRSLSLLLILMLVLPAGCTKKTQITGKVFIQREIFVDVLVDLHLVDGISSDRKFFRKYEGVDSIDVLGPVLEKYQVSHQMFDTTIYEYSRYPELFDQVYNDVLMKLNIMLDENDLDEISIPEE
ncbi:MAG: DUF4296 domain-containing protein [Bacteroidetes bacterium]|nr:DUF4296 domain-containing protein [Bacteroidota bacterium]